MPIGDAKLVHSKQVGIRFLWCESPITIDKRSAWGSDAENLQVAKDGAFLKLANEFEISHLVQPNAEKDAPIGWVPGSEPGTFDKSPIYLCETVQAGERVTIKTLDGEITYTAKEKSVVCANQKDGQPDFNDRWVQSATELAKHYVVGDALAKR